MNLFKLSDHPQIGPHIEGMKSEINKYHAIVQSIKSVDERKDAKGRDTFSLPEWWRFNSGALPHFSFVLRALLTNAPNSCPPERLFSMFNATFGEDQRPSGTTLSWQCSRSTTNAISKVLLFCVCVCVCVCVMRYIYIYVSSSPSACGVCVCVCVCSSIYF